MAKVKDSSEKFEPLKVSGYPEVIDETAEIRIDPDLAGMVNKCYKELKGKFPHYGNTWLTGTKAYYIKRIQEELNELNAAPNISSAQRKCVNLVNIVTMCHDSYGKNEHKKRTVCPNCHTGFEASDE